MDSKGVSPMIATIVLIAIVFAVAAILALSLASSPTPSPPWGGQLTLENIQSGRDVIVIWHRGGERANDVVENSPSDNKFHWRNLELRVNGRTVPAENIVTFISDGRDAIGRGTGYYPLVAGDRMRVKLGTPLSKGDKVGLKWIPTNQIILELEVRE